MFLEKLTITSSKGVIRDIPFKLRGLNLIIDTTISTEDKRASGNNVGKTTFIRSVDFCLGSSGSDLYQDKELRTDNELVKNFLEENEVTFILSVVNMSGVKTTIQRSFDQEKDLFINNNQYASIKEYKNELNQIFFGLKNDNAVHFRTLIKKFVRSDEFSANNILKILHTSTNQTVYWGMYLTLFGFTDHDLIKQESLLIRRLDKLNKKLKVVKGIYSLDQLKQKLTILENQVHEKEKHVKAFDLPETYGSLVKKLTEIKDITSNLSSEVSGLTTKIAFNAKTRNELQQSQIHIDPQAIKQLYEEAKKLIPTLQKEFEEILDFHQKMIANKVKFIDQHIQKLENDRISKKSFLDSKLDEQGAILRLLENSGTFDDLIKVRSELDNLLIEKGKVLNQSEQIEDLQNQIKESSDLLKEYQENFKNKKDVIKANTDVFNTYLITYSERAHGEKLYIYYDSEKDKFDLSNLQGNAGKGYKKSDIISFDLAFISFIAETGLKFPRFVLHDELEIIHPNQIETIFDVANTIDGQLFISVLKDKITFLGDKFVSDHQILSLSQDDKFFRI
jgi:uncharacterized protein YydD (DUF2326 family)